MCSYMLFVRPLSEAEIATLTDAHKYHHLSWTRIRAHCILLSGQKYQVQEIASILSICRQTVCASIHNWDSIGFLGLVDEYRTGRPSELTQEQKDSLIEKVIESPRSLKKVLSNFIETNGVEISLDTLKRICKAAKLSWKRIRKSLKSKRNEDDFQFSKSIIYQLIEDYKLGKINLKYFDESGFSLVPCIPYAWQKIGEHIEVPSSKSKSINVLGFIGRDCDFDSFAFTGSITSDVVIGCFDEFSNTCDINKPTVVIVDNAPTHTSDKFDKKTIDWCAKGLIVVPIAKYSPELNIIEILWRKIKYEWMPFSAYNSFEDLEKSLFDILSGVGTNFKIQFG